MTREELADKMSSLPNPPSRVHLVQQVYDIMHEDAEREHNKLEKSKEQLTKAIKIIKGLLELGSIGDGDYTYVRDAEQFLEEAQHG